jgi:hypothetical protein
LRKPYAAQALGSVLAHPVLARKLVKSRERCVRRGDARAGVLLLVEVIRFDMERANHGRQGQALDDKRPENDAEGQEDDQIPLREGTTCIGGQWNRERSG